MSLELVQQPGLAKSISKYEASYYFDEVSKLGYIVTNNNFIHTETKVEHFQTSELILQMIEKVTKLGCFTVGFSRTKYYYAILIKLPIPAPSREYSPPTYHSLWTLTHSQLKEDDKKGRAFYKSNLAGTNQF